MSDGSAKPELTGTEPVAQESEIPHDSARLHVTGRADYVDDMPEPAGTLHAAIGLATIARGRIAAMDLDAVAAAPGVVAVLTAKDIPGANTASAMGKGVHPLLAEGRVDYHGQPLFLVVAEERMAARRAARLGRIDYAPEPPVLDIAAARTAGAAPIAAGLTVRRGDVAAALESSPRRLSGRMSVGGQEHFYIEGQIALALPREDDELLVYSATQDPGEVQSVVAHMLNLPANAVAVSVRRMGGAFGGKESQPAIFAALAALAADRLKRPVKLRPDRDDDMTITGKRHDFTVDYEIGFTDEGRITGLDATLYARAGHSEDLTRGVADRAVLHVDNAYFYPAARAESRCLFTNTVSNTAFRGYGGPQGIAAAERWIEDIAYTLGMDPLEVRRRNFYGEGARGVTHYHQPVRDNILARVVDELERTSDYQRRRAKVIAFNRGTAGPIRRGIALVPVKFGISYSAKFMNQGAALLSVYRDGSVHISHAGTEMGQGIHTKILQIAASEFGLPLSRVRVTATATDRVPNTVPTSGSLGTDLNGMAVVDAARKIKARLADLVAPGLPTEEIGFEAGEVLTPEGRVGFADLVERAFKSRVSLSATGYYRTPHIHWDRAAGRGSPYLYFTYGASCSEVAVDTLTGEYRVLRTDILQDVGHSINRDIDLGQIEGGFMQGLGWSTTEELWWDGSGRLATHAPSTYKIPLASDRPAVLNIGIAEWSENAAPTVMRSKAVGEPPVMLALSVPGALAMAAASLADYAFPPKLDLPATPERVLAECARQRQMAQRAPGVRAAE
ncbi:xanthine dehydrogenase molybdopterin binding subunit [Celeribacter indicus]|uniref:Xanthine dehydrogenase molybdopterin binding subunit n=1 Tax=Celeribacter indicus TaxID=1208324 RepID=A0A0B5E140_9RHOB|nr:xanthine dehydrogenase molybdopterin binding subunit [Celeribacter indicus]AJE47120.1 xanthine dehydrogenase molybdopterin binding subunit [Celeribacter indicus]SDW90337.1 xanthine dehydrogenase, molybdenum binding subunit apoprotein [Celeribacter indicus]